MDYKSLVSSYSKRLETFIQSSRAALRHAGQKGNVAETAFAEILRDALPSRIGITEGIVVSSDGFVSGQIDLILYDAVSSPCFFSVGRTKAIPIEYVYATIEVKTTLSAQHVRDFSRDNADLRSQQKNFVGDTSPKSIRPRGFTYHRAGRDWYAPPINSYIFSYECNSVSGCWEAFRECMSGTYAEWVDGICIGNNAFMTRASKENGLADMIAEPAVLALVEEGSFLAFLAHLWIESTDWYMRETPALYHYFKGHGHFGAPTEAPFVGTDLHPDCKP